MLVSVEEYHYLVAWHNKRQQHDYEVARWICYHILEQNPYIKNKPLSLQRYIRFGWEKVKRTKPSKVTQGEVNELYRIFKEITEKNEQSR